MHTWACNQAHTYSLVGKLQTTMDLRHFLFDHRITQQELIRAIAKRKAKFHHPHMSKIVNGKMKLGGVHKERIIQGLQQLGFSSDQIKAIDGLM